MAANERVVESAASIVREAGTIPGLPILNIQQSQEAPFQFDPLGSGLPGVGVRGPGFALGNLAQSQDVATQVSGLPMLGPFGVIPEVEQREVRVCPTGHRLALDGLCYPKALLAKRSRLRMWPAEAAPPITRAEGRSLATRARTEKKIKSLGKRAGLKVTG